ncbi:MAG: hypothetical protein JNM11_04990 [Chitinimonas sp.]|nr:hypothetical protein [Chitinimonas sp.]
MRKIIHALLLIAIPIASNASETCNTILTMGLYNTTTASSSTDAQSLALSTFCSADYSNNSISSTQSAQIEASYGLFSGGAGGTASKQDIITKQSQVCTLGFNSSAYSNKTSGYSKIIYQGSLDAWNKCQHIATKGVEFSIQPSSTLLGVTVLITAKPGLSAIYYGVEQLGSGTSKCTTMANGKVLNPSASEPFIFTASSNVTITCKRNLVANGSDLSADAQDLVFVTSADSLTVPLAAIGNFSRVTADKIKSDTIATIGLSGSVVAFSSQNCPTGWKPYEKARGRTIIGSGEGTGLSNRIFNSMGGTEKHKLTIAEIPQHSHDFFGTGFNFGSMDMSAAYTNSIAMGKSQLAAKFTPSGSLSQTGGGGEHENMQPWLALQYCVKQ